MNQNETNEHSGTVSKFFYSNLITGLLIVAPIIVTIWVGVWVFNLLTGWSADLYGKISGMPLSSGMEFGLRMLAILIIFIFIFVVGLLAKITVGRKLILIMQGILKRLPMLRSVYSTCEQISETVQSSRGGLFKQVALFEYPRKGSYAVGFVTNFNEQKFEINGKLNKELYSIFLPTTPNPTSGFLIYVPKDECILLEMSASEAMTLIVSCGTTLPGMKMEKTLDI